MQQISYKYQNPFTVVNKGSVTEQCSTMKLYSRICKLNTNFLVNYVTLLTVTTYSSDCSILHCHVINTIQYSVYFFFLLLYLVTMSIHLYLVLLRIPVF